MLRPNGTQDRSSAAVVVGGFYTVILSQGRGGHLQVELSGLKLRCRHPTPSFSSPNGTGTRVKILKKRLVYFIIFSRVVCTRYVIYIKSKKILETSYLNFPLSLFWYRDL